MHYFCNKIPVHSKALIVKFHIEKSIPRKFQPLLNFKVLASTSGAQRVPGERGSQQILSLHVKIRRSQDAALPQNFPILYIIYAWSSRKQVSSEIEVFVRSASQGEYGTILEEIIGFSS